MFVNLYNLELESFALTQKILPKIFDEFFKTNTLLLKTHQKIILGKIFWVRVNEPYP